MPKQSRAQISGSKVSNSSAKARGFDSSSRLLENASRRQMDRRDALKVGIGGLFGLLLTGKAKADERVARAEVSKNEVKYETFSDPKELEPYFKEAESMIVKINPNGVTQVGAFQVRVIHSDKYGVDFKVKDSSGKEEKLVFSSSLSEINVLEVDVGRNNPNIQGNVAVFASDTLVCFAYQSSKGPKVTSLSFMNGNMRQGPIRSGVGFDGDALLVMGSPNPLREGDVVYQAQFGANGLTGAYFKYMKNQPPGTMIASL